MSEATRALAKFAGKLREWRRDPVSFVRDVFGPERIDAWQVDALRNFAEHQRSAWKACKGPGKTCVEAWAIWNFLLTRPHPKVICTSITGDNLDDGLWTELSVWYSRNKSLPEGNPYRGLLELLFEIKGESITCREAPNTWYCSARTWPKAGDSTQQADSLAGIHGDYTLVVLDEVSDYPDGVVVAAEASLSTGVENKIVVAGNPTRQDGPLWRICTTDRANWAVLEITGDPDDPKRAPRISVEWARQMIKTWGKDNPWVLVNVFGKFPPTASDKLIGPEDVSEAAQRTLEELVYSRHPRVLGVDVARYGDDRSVICPRQGPVCFQHRIFRNLSVPELADQVIRCAVMWKADCIFVDDVGVGGGVTDLVRQHGFSVVPVNNGARATEHERFANKWSEMWWAAALWVKGSGCLPNLGDLLGELQLPTYSFDQSQRLVVEPNKKIKERVGYSLDVASAFLNTFASPVAPRDLNIGPHHPAFAAGSGARVADFTPFSRQEA